MEKNQQWNEKNMSVLCIEASQSTGCGGRETPFLMSNFTIDCTIANTRRNNYFRQDFHLEIPFAVMAQFFDHLHSIANNGKQQQNVMQ